MLQQLLNSFWYPKTRTPLLFIIALAPVLFFLWILSYIYEVGFTLFKWYKTMFCGKVSLTVPTISVGNISVGGTGKTEVVSWLAHSIGEQSVIIVLKGYNSHKPISPPRVVSPFDDAVIVGDEPLMLARRLKSIIIVSNHKKQGVLYAQKLIQQGKVSASTIIIDDGYQQFSLDITEHIVLLDARYPFGNGHVLPLGPLRERDLSRAQKLIVTNSSVLSVREKSSLQNQLQKKCPTANVLFGYYNVSLQQSLTSKNRVIAITAIARPENFFSTVRDFAIVTYTQSYVDHYQYVKKDIDKIVELLQEYKSDYVITTEKDWVKLQPLIDKRYQELFIVTQVTFILDTQQ